MQKERKEKRPDIKVNMSLIHKMTVGNSCDFFVIIVVVVVVVGGVACWLLYIGVVIAATYVVADRKPFLNLLHKYFNISP